LPGLLLGIPAAALAKVAWRFFRSQPVRPADITIKAPDGSETPATPPGGDGEPLAVRVERAKIA
jgi:hypothetical protein